MFCGSRHILDLCICTQGISKHASLKIIPQPYSDHAALMPTVHLQKGIKSI